MEWTESDDRILRTILLNRYRDTQESSERELARRFDTPGWLEEHLDMRQNMSMINEYAAHDGID